jgi:hypothetical protein
VLGFVFANVFVLWGGRCVCVRVFVCMRKSAGDSAQAAGRAEWRAGAAAPAHMHARACVRVCVFACVRV